MFFIFVGFQSQDILFCFYLLIQFTILNIPAIEITVLQ